jgi:hypothetical protein
VKQHERTKWAWTVLTVATSRNIIMRRTAWTFIVWLWRVVMIINVCERERERLHFFFVCLSLLAQGVWLVHFVEARRAPLLLVIHKPAILQLCPGPNSSRNESPSPSVHPGARMDREHSAAAQCCSSSGQLDVVRPPGTWRQQQHSSSALLVCVCVCVCVVVIVFQNRFF